MKKRLCIIVLLALISACGSFNEGTAELHINKNVTTGQELMDLQTVLDKGIITQEEFDKLREIDIEEFENLDGDKSENVKIRININGNDIVNIDSEDE